MQTVSTEATRGLAGDVQKRPSDDWYDDDNDADHLRTKYPTGIDIIIFDLNGVVVMEEAYRFDSSCSTDMMITICKHSHTMLWMMFSINLVAIY